MSYRIKRFRSVEKESLFSKRLLDKRRLNQAYEICYETIKCLEMYDNDSYDSNHWLKKLVSALTVKSNNSFSNSLPLARFVESRELLIADEDIKSEVFGGLFGEKFVSSVRKDIKQKSYGRLMKGDIHDDKFYVKFFSVLSLILEKKFNIDFVDTNTLYEMDNIPIEITDNGPLTPSYMLKDILSKYIVSVKGYNNGKFNI